MAKIKRVPTKTDLEILTDARSYIADPNDWCKENLIDPERRHCAIGAVAAAIRGKPRDRSVDAWEMQDEIMPTLAKLARQLPVEWRKSFDPDRAWGRIAKYNNTQSHDDVIRLFDKAIAAE